MFFFLVNYTCSRSFKLISRASSYKHLLPIKQVQFFSSKLDLSIIQETGVANSGEKTTSAEKKFKDKIIYNSIIKYEYVNEDFERHKLDDEIFSQYKTKGPPVLALKYFTKDNNKETSEIHESDLINLPYEKYHHVTLNSSNGDTLTDVYEDDELYNDVPYDNIRDRSFKKPRSKKWMTNYNKYVEVYVKEDEREEDKEHDTISQENYGSADPNVPVSSVPCGGCGAHLHCQDSAIPGFLPKEIFSRLKKEQLQSVVCQRCHFLQEYNTALNVSVNPELYPQLISKIKGQKALVILVVDMTDFPCSIWPGILDILGPKRPLFVVGNKIDLLQDWSRDMLTRAKESLIKQLPPKANLLHVSLISAKTGYGIEQLITSLYKLWEYRGDVYLVGCTNVGKSTLFNALLQSDYCKTKAVDLVQKATTAPWPGTTLNLLKFPIARAEGWKLAVRTARLREENIKELRHIQEGEVQPTPQMICKISRTFAHGNTDRVMDEYYEDPFAMPKMATLRRLRAPGSGLDPEDPLFVLGKWLYDTPGVITPDQNIDLLTTEELMLTLPQKPIIPRTFQVFLGQSLLVGGLGRVDYVSGTSNIKMTVLAAKTLPVTICTITNIDEVYEHYLGTEVLAVPSGSEERLRRWPGLQAGPQFVLKGEGWRESCADIVLSSAGWVAVTAPADATCTLQAWTPQGRGIHVRIPPVLPRAIAVKGRRMYKNQAYALYNESVQRKKR